MIKAIIYKGKTIVYTLALKVRFWGKIRTKGHQHIPLLTEIKINEGGKIVMGNNVTCFRRCCFSAIGGEIVIGSNVSFGRNGIIVAHEKIQIGSGCGFGPNLVIYDHDHVFNAEGFKSSEYKSSEVIIEDGCWIGANVTILRGTKIGQGSVIGAGTVVKGNIPSHSLVTSDRELSICPINIK